MSNYRELRFKNYENACMKQHGSTYKPTAVCEVYSAF